MKYTILFSLLIANFCFGQTVIEGKYSEKKNFFQQNKTEYWISEFEGDFAKFSKSGYTGIINKAGEIILPMEYDEVYISDSLFCGKKRGAYYIFTTKGESIRVPKYDYLVKNKGIIYIDYFQSYHAIKLIGNPFESAQVFQYGNVILDVNGNIITEIPDNITIYFHDGVAAINNGRYKDKKYGYINTKGETVLPMEYDHCNMFSNRRGIVRLGNKRAVVDDHGNFITPFTTHIISSSNYSNGLCRYRDSTSRKFGYIDTNGIFAIQPKYDKAENFISGFAKVEENGVEYIIDVKGKKYKTNQNWFTEGYRFQSYEDKVVYEDRVGNVVFDFKYGNHPSSTYYTEGLAKVELNGKEGVIDRLGNEIIPPVYNKVKIDHIYVLVEDKNDIWLMSKRGEKIKSVHARSKAKATHLTNYSISSGFNQYGFLITRRDDKVGLINTNADEILPISFDRIYVNEYYIIASIGDKMEVYNYSGDKEIPIETQQIVCKTNKGFIVKRGEKLILFDNEFKPLYTVDSIDLNYPSPGNGHPSGIYPYKHSASGKFGYLDLINLKNSQPIYNALGFYGNHLVFCKEGNKKMMIKPKSNEKLDINFYVVRIVGRKILIVRKEKEGPLIDFPDDGGLFTIDKEWSYGIMNQDGELILPIQYAQFKQISSLRDKSAVIPNDAILFTIHKNEYIFINIDGRIID